MSDLTIRQRLEAIQDRHTRYYGTIDSDGDVRGCCEACDETWPCPDFEDAVAALKALDEAEKRHQEHDPENGGNVTSRLVPDPKVPDA